MFKHKLKNARYIGFLYLIIAIISPFALMYVPSLIVGETSTEILQNIVENERLFRFGIVAQTLIFLFEVILLSLLYTVFKEVNPTVSVISMTSRLSMTIVQGVNVIASLTVVGLLSANSIDLGYYDQAAYSLYKFQEYGTCIWQIFFGLHLVALGYLVYKSNYVSKWFGVLLMIASLGYLINAYGVVLSLDSDIFISIKTTFLFISTIGEVAFLVRLIAKKITIDSVN